MSNNALKAIHFIKRVIKIVPLVHDVILDGSHHDLYKLLTHLGMN